jgi:signal transduction histidine kinase/CheY-like chemotaxis protein
MPNPNADAFPFPTLPAPLRFAIALATVGLVYFAERTFGALIDDGSQFLLLGTAVMASAWFAGTGPALAATVFGAVLGAWDASIVNSSSASQTHLALFVLQGLILTGLVSELRAARRRAEQQAHEAHAARQESDAANRMKDEFLGTVSHELRTPLNAVLGWVHLLRTCKLDQTTADRGLESIERNVRLQAQLTGNLLDISKSLTGELRLDLRRTAVADSIREAVSAAAAAAEAKGVRIECHLPQTPAIVLGDPARLRQIVWHLIGNAVKFTPRGGKVGVDVNADSDHVVVDVYDSGPGITPQFLPRLFERFTQEDPSLTRTAGGLGVGLSLVRQLVELHGGTIHARNRENGSGAIFTVRLPRQPAGVAEVSVRRKISSSASTVPARLEGIRVLVLDRDAEGRDLLRTTLQQHGATVRTVQSVAEALEALEAWRPDALVTDSCSPNQDTYALVGKVGWLEADRGGRIPAAALTAYGRTDERVRQMLDAVQCDLPKPLEPSVLTAEIARLTGRERRSIERAH